MYQNYCAKALILLTLRNKFIERHKFRNYVTSRVTGHF